MYVTCKPIYHLCMFFFLLLVHIMMLLLLLVHPIGNGYTVHYHIIIFIVLGKLSSKWL